MLPRVLAADPDRDGLGERVLGHVMNLEILAAQRGRAGDQPHPGHPFLVQRPVGAAVLRHDRVGDRSPQRLVGRALAQRGPDPHGPVEAERADGLVLAAEVVIERTRRDPGRLGDVLDEHVIQAAGDRQLHRGHAERLPGGDLLALAQPRRVLGLPRRLAAQFGGGLGSSRLQGYLNFRIPQLCSARNFAGHAQITLPRRPPAQLAPRHSPAAPAGPPPPVFLSFARLSRGPPWLLGPFVSA